MAVSATPVPSPALTLVPAPTLQMALEGYLADPGRRRHAKATSVYRHKVRYRGIDVRHLHRQAAEI